MTVTTETLSPSGRVIERQVMLKATGQVLDQARYGYDGPGDNPAYELTSAGSLAATFGPGGANHRPGQPSTWPVTDVAGHVVAVVASDGTITPAPIADEFGVEIAADPRDPAKLESRYGWLGAHQRPAVGDTSGVTRMGVRLYHPGLGRFLEVDPVEAGSANDYDYVNADPINGIDLDGRACRRRDANSKVQARFTRRNVYGQGSTRTYLRCGDRGWGRRHIERRGHFGGALNWFELSLIGETLANSGSTRTVQYGRDRNNVYVVHEYGFGCRNIYGRVVFNFTVRVSVNDRTNNIVSAYITDPYWDKRGVAATDCS